jgi:hypothetical protein
LIGSKRAAETESAASMARGGRWKPKRVAD